MAMQDYNWNDLDAALNAARASVGQALFRHRSRVQFPEVILEQVQEARKALDRAEAILKLHVRDEPAKGLGDKAWWQDGA